MKKYILTSPTLNGPITFGFNEDGFLTFYNNEANQAEPQIKALLRRLPRAVEELPNLTNGTQATLTEVPEDLSFDRFWRAQAPGKKIHRFRCEPLWKKMSDNNKMLAIMRYPAYLEYCAKNQRGIVDPENYLKKQYYLTDWRAEK